MPGKALQTRKERRKDGEKKKVRREQKGRARERERERESERVCEYRKKEREWRERERERESLILVWLKVESSPGSLSRLNFDQSWAMWEINNFPWVLFLWCSGRVSFYLLVYVWECLLFSMLYSIFYKYSQGKIHPKVTYSSPKKILPKGRCCNEGVFGYALQMDFNVLFLVVYLGFLTPSSLPIMHPVAPRQKYKSN